MVEFKNIVFDKDWVYADAYDHDFKVGGRIKVHRRDSIFETNCQSCNNFKKASWSLRRKVNSNKVKKNGSLTVAWG